MINGDHDGANDDLIDEESSGDNDGDLQDLLPPAHPRHWARLHLRLPRCSTELHRTQCYSPTSWTRASSLTTSSVRCWKNQTRCTVDFDTLVPSASAKLEPLALWIDVSYHFKTGWLSLLHLIKKIKKGFKWCFNGKVSHNIFDVSTHWKLIQTCSCFQ